LEPPYVGVGSLNTPKTTISLDSGTFPSPAPKVGDLVRILDKENANSSFHRILSVTTSSVTVDVAFSLASTSFSFLVTVADNLTTGTFTTISGTSLIDSGKDFVALGIVPGSTVILTANLLRRQVVRVVSATELEINHAFSSVASNVYRISNPLNTYSELSELSSATSTLVSILSTNSNSTKESISKFFDSSFTDRFTSSVTGSFTGNTLTVSGADLVAYGVQVGDYVYAPLPQTSTGVYRVDAVLSPTELTVVGSPTAGSVTCRIVSSFGVSESTLQDAFSIQDQVLEFSTTVGSWSTVVDTVVPVQDTLSTTDAYSFARGYLPSSLGSWLAEVESRESSLATQVTTLESVLNSRDRLYDNRYTWIDSRINLEKGILVKKKRAIASREKAQEDSLKQLIKLESI
jgi:hypothetical protein